uniref:Uncharacterized protein n=1 Tax=Phlebopus portentosus TaxID=80661 RepID=A0A481ZKC0_9AGAM|nr:hypothetical protein [Phlebopus portentosus]
MLISKMCIKLLFGYILIVCFVLRLLGFNSVIGFFNNMYYLKKYIYVVGILILIYLMVELLILYLFMTKKIKISEILPESIIDWLKAIEHFSTNTEKIKNI